MHSTWGLIRDNDEWDAVCHQTQDMAPYSIIMPEPVCGFFATAKNQDQGCYLDDSSLCATIDALFEQCGGRYTMRVTRYDHEPGSSANTTPDLCMYKKHERAEDAFKLDPAADATRKAVMGHGNAPISSKDGDREWLSEDDVLSERLDQLSSQDKADSAWRNDIREHDPEVLQAILPYRARTAWAWITTLVLIEDDQSSTPYQVNPDGVLSLPDSPGARKTRARVCKCVSEVFLRQHRRFFFAAILVRSTAFLMRWDRAGALVTTPFDYIEDPQKLSKFFYRIAMADRSLQGYDSTVTLASDDEVKTLRAYRDSLPYGTRVLRDYVDRSLENETFFPIQKITVYHDAPVVPVLRDHEYHTTNTREDKREAEPAGLTPQSMNTTRRSRAFLMGKHHYGSRSLIGRGGKGFVAYDLDQRRSVFLKDYWYMDHPTAHPETEVYQKLARTKVRNVATLLAGGDVAGYSSGFQETLTQEYLTSEPMPAKRRHHRLVVKEIGRPLESYQNGRELIQALHDALLAHCDAYEKAEILHRDVSMNNILIDVATGKAFLNDWDLCKYRCELNGKANQHAPVGTWPYMSATLVEFPRKPNELADDMESFLHVFTIAILRSHPHSLSSKRIGMPNGALEAHLHVMYFGSDRSPAGYCIGLKAKLRVMQAGRPDFEVKSTSPMLSTLLTRLFELGGNHYAMLDLDQLEEDWGDDAISGQPRSHASDPQKGFNTHHLFLDIVSKILEERKFQSALEEKTEDQFQHLAPLVRDVGSWRSNKRPSEESRSSRR